MTKTYSATTTSRGTKGSALTYTEMDNNINTIGFLDSDVTDLKADVISLDSDVTDLTSRVSSSIVVQTKTLSTSATNNITSVDYVDVAGMSMSFTAKFSNSLLLFTLQNHVYLDAGGGTWNGVDFRVLKDGSTTIFTGGSGGGGGYGTAHAGGGASNQRLMLYVTQNFEHSPNSTSAHTYKVQVHLTNNEANGTKEVNNPNYGAGGRLVIMEIAQ